MGYQAIQITKAALNKQKKQEVSPFLISKHYKAIVTQTIQYLHEDRHIHKWNKIESQEIKPYIYGYIIFNKGVKTIQLGKNSLVEKTGCPPVEE